MIIKLEYSGYIFKKSSNFMKIRPVGAELFHANGQTDLAKLKVAFRNLANALKDDHESSKVNYPDDIQ